MNINALAGAYAPTYVSESTKQRANHDHWDALMEHRQREAVENRNRLGLDQLEAYSNAARARVQSMEQTDDISSLPLSERLALIRQEGEKVDRSNMTDKEVFEEIYARFDEYLSDEEWPNVSFTYSYPGKNDISKACNDELESLAEAGWSVERRRAAYAAMQGYEGMSADEMKKAITQKYASEGPMTPYRFNAMMDEMRKSGAMDFHDALRISVAVWGSISVHVDTHYMNNGVDYDTLVNDNYYERTKDKYMEMYHDPIGFSGIRDDLIYRMTDGGGKNAETERTIYDFLEFLAGLNLL